MIDISTWVPDFLNALERAFDDRVWFAGLQGSYARGEASDRSDIDLVVILDRLTAEDITIYNTMLDGLTDRELICGFLSGKDELINWEPADLFQFYYDTIPLKGSLDELRTLIDDTAVARAVKMGACNIYHGCVHNMLYEKSEDILKGLYKAATFVIQAAYFLRSGTYIRHLQALCSLVSVDDRQILDTHIRLKNGMCVDFSEMSEAIFHWAQAYITGV